NAHFAIKPMNCPGGVLVFKNAPKSYRDLPIRLAELGLVHRHEMSGVLHGLFRVKAFTIDDAHIYCTEAQIQEEMSQCLKLILGLYKAFGFEKVHIELSTRPKDSMGSDEIWEKATSGLVRALDSAGIRYGVQEGGGAFYGPKIDFHIEDSIGRTWQCGTIQLDFSMPERFEIEYIGPDGKPHRPVMIHRAVFGSVERFFGILTEHFAGAFPIWLSPVQIRVCSISERQEAYAREVAGALKQAGLRAQLDIAPEKISYKIRQAEVEKTPYIAVVGDREAAARTAALRARGRKDCGVMALEDIIARLQNEIKQKI
ncbi:MAG: threonine--tRNA ligase, partial [Candidatus Omnitrophica bacterium]|nr:threonine--tRNA ligase [Candidatus Omnitrophota bacterium]